MSETPPIAAHAHIALASQVGGHAGVETTEDGSLIIKPVLNNELEFYQSLRQNPALSALLQFTPNFLGTLKLEGTVDSTKPDSKEGIIVEPVADSKDIIVLENLSFGFLKPNILDVKLGTVLYDETASPDKVARMEKAAKDTTSFETGVRLTGFQVYDNITSQPVHTLKAYGKSIQASQLSEGIAKFFPLASNSNNNNNSNNNANVSTPSSSSGLPRSTLVSILRAIREEITLIRETFSTLELRMVGGSLLIIYEADWARAEEGIKNYLDLHEEGKKMKEAADEDEGEEGGGVDLDQEDDDEESDDDDETRTGPPFVVRLIDFAHTILVPGKGPDEGVLLGMDTVLRLLDGRLSELAVFS